MLQVMGGLENKNCYLLFLKQNKQRPLTPLELNLPSVFRTDSALIQKNILTDFRHADSLIIELPHFLIIASG